MFVLWKQNITKIKSLHLQLRGNPFLQSQYLSNSDSPIIKEFPDVIQETLPGLPPCREIEHKIKILRTLPKPSPIYKLSPLKDETLRNHLNNALNKNLIRAFKSPYGAAVFFVQNKDGSLRLVTDYCALNAVIIKTGTLFHSSASC